MKKQDFEEIKSDLSSSNWKLCLLKLGWENNKGEFLSLALLRKIEYLFGVSFLKKCSRNTQILEEISRIKHSEVLESYIKKALSIFKRHLSDIDIKILLTSRNSNVRKEAKTLVNVEKEKNGG